MSRQNNRGSTFHGPRGYASTVGSTGDSSAALQVAGESETGDNHDDGEDDEEEAVDDNGQATPVRLGGCTDRLLDDTRPVVGDPGAHRVTHGDVRHHLRLAD